ncbi:uncharacterized protein [Musca autumnalis]|uniref:uncharacterized protein n=1 Tax=Musca autumnalis TaxID=221902 RepID=UPI003CE8AF74
MLISNPDIINSCRVCRSPNHEDSDYECIYEIQGDLPMTPPLTEAGKLYENLFTKLLPETYDYYPRYLCNSCGLQMKLFGKLKDKALNTLKYLGKLYDEDLLAFGDEERIIIEEEEITQEQGNNFTNIEYENNAENTTTIEESQYIGPQADIATINVLPNNVLMLPADQQENQTDNNDLADILESNQMKHEENEEEITQNTDDLEDCGVSLDKSDYVMEIYKVIDDNTQSDAVEEDNTLAEQSTVASGDNFETETIDSCDFTIEEVTSQLSGNDEPYVDIESFVTSEGSEGSLRTPTKRRRSERRRTLSIGGHLKVLSCTECTEIFTEAEEYKYHCSYIHAQSDGYACKVCDAVLKSARSLASHMKTHSEKPAYKCEICQRTFKQKVHYQYHMNRHNNIRNFHCDQCDKSFLAKSDLKIHQRQHTGHRPHVCEICGNSYMAAEHLRTHLIKHMDVQFPCELCPQKFANPKTLRQHVTSIHASEPRFKCEFCSKPFRRKHHLKYHMKLHPQNISKDSNCISNQHDKVDANSIFNEQDVDNPEEVLSNNDNNDGDDENDIIKDSGFVALNDETILV